jgi:internalin A
VFLRHPIATYASEALLELRDPAQLAIEVRAPSPDLFFHVLSDSVEALVTSRWQGLGYELLVPCPRQGLGGSSCPGQFSLEILQRLHERGKPEVTCLSCAEDYPVELLLTGFMQPDEPLAAQVRQQLSRVEDRLIRIEGQAADNAGAVRRVLRVVSTEVPDCPSLFTLTRQKSAGGRQLRFYQHHYRITLWCQEPGHWHPWEPATYEIDPPKDWFTRVGPYAAIVVRTLQLAVPLAGSIAVASLPAEQRESAAAHLDMMKTIVEDLPSDSLRQAEVDPGEATGQMSLAEGAAQRALRQIIFEHDRSRRFGGLRRVQSPSGEFLWVCPDHTSDYDPGLPDLPL